MELMIHVDVPAGVARVVLEGCLRGELKAWVPKAIARVPVGATEVTFTLGLDLGVEMFRARLDSVDPLPAAWYSGRTNFPVEPATDPLFVRRNLEDAAATAPGAGGAGEETRSVVESDIWAKRGEILYFFNELRGLQVIDLTNPDQPALQGTFRLPGSGEQMYLAGDKHVVLLAHDPCRQWSTDAESAVWVVDTSVLPPVEVARLPLKGRIVESRWVGTALYVATETWEPLNDGTGSWRSGTHVASFDFEKPEVPVARGTLWFPGSGNVVTATDRFLFVAVTDYSKTWPWGSHLEVIDISEPDGSLANWAKIPLAGRVPDKFKIDVLENVLRVVVEAVESPETWRFVTVLETYRLSDPRSASPLPILRLDRLELARGERLFATRFDGTRGYVVTFERVDPLWVIDLSNPSDLRVAGELEIPGWSTYIRPMGDRLLTLGVDDDRGWRVAVQLFDVADPANPLLLAKVPLGEDSSWSEATSDEKAFGVFPEAGLLMVPVSEWKNTGGEHGVQLLDLGRNTVTKRGLLKSDSIVPRRATLHRERVVTFSGRAITSADIGDRDEPKVRATVELAYPVERVLLVGDHLLEFQSGSVRVRRPEDRVAGVSIPVGDLPVLGAMEAGGRVHVLQGRGAEVLWEADAVSGEWIPRTNAGVMLASVWDASGLPGLTKTGESAIPTERTWVGDAEGLWLREGLLVWASRSNEGYPWFYGLGNADMARVAGTDLAVGRFWRPWWGNGSRNLIAVGISGGGVPQIVSDLSLGGDSQSVGDVFHAGPLVFSSREKTESEVVGTNTVVESAWFPGPARLETNVVVAEDGMSKTNVTASNEGEWRPVTNSYPVLRWWSHYELDVVDYGFDPAAPVRRPALVLPGALEGVARDGSLLFTAAWKTGEAKESRKAWLDACAYDGVTVHLIDSTPIADEGLSETYAVVARNEVAYVARGGWSADARQRMESWYLSDGGQWSRGGTVGTVAAPGELRLFGDVLLARGGGETELFGVQNAPGMDPLPVIQTPGCYGGELGRADGDLLRGVWLPLWEYGAVRVGPP